MFLLPGWGESEGVEIEIEAAEALGSGTTYSETLEKFTGVTPAQSAELHRGISGSVSYKSCAQCTASTILAGCVNRFCRFDSFSDC